MSFTVVGLRCRVIGQLKSSLLFRVKSETWRPTLLSFLPPAREKIRSSTDHGPDNSLGRSVRQIQTTPVEDQEEKCVQHAFPSFFFCHHSSHLSPSSSPPSSSSHHGPSAVLPHPATERQLVRLAHVALGCIHRLQSHLLEHRRKKRLNRHPSSSRSFSTHTDTLTNHRVLVPVSHHVEYHSKFITRLFKGNSLYGCYALAATIFTLGLIRDAM